jgi:hypothetical protein
VLTIPTSIDTRDDIAFVHNLDDPLYGEDGQDAIRDVRTQTYYWTLQVLAAYEGVDTADGDGESLLIGGETSILNAGPVIIYLEALRDANAHLANCVDMERLRQRAVLHETIHRFEHPDHDEAVMSYALFWTAPDNQILLTGNLLKRIRNHNP